jgi:hypothetical protein
MLVNYCTFITMLIIYNYLNTDHGYFKLVTRYWVTSFYSSTLIGEL